MEEVANSELAVKSIPSPDSSRGVIWDFALTFNGYHHWGSFEKCAEVANQERDATLTDLRTCLFFEFQRWRHYGDDPEDEAAPYIRGIVLKIREMVLSDRRE
jgi:hypothetical protein